MDSTGWKNFWESEKRSFNDVMKINTSYFASQIDRLFSLQPSDRILDYGCGPGLLADNLAMKEISVTGVDINEYFIEECKSKHPQSLFITISTNVEVNKEILRNNLAGKKFDYIIFLSVTQYLNDAAELESKINVLLPYLVKDGKIVIADVVDENTSSVRDFFSLFFECLRKGKIIAFTRFIFYLLFSNYRTLSRTKKLLRLSEEQIRKIAETHSLTVKRIEGLTLHSTRTNYILS